MRNSDFETAGIASSLAAKIYGGKIIKHGIQDREDNYTTFVVLQR